ncbi:CPXCG motif-containing cysteine-rich protein [Sulfidibacter corallicola]|uniref:CPXCG motif-containing cysteine-rich protein n=1 Tax=Sulfidibacter corallicola TaxID=2818388 RepID=A0A8A4U2N7_SULCO|nr:CPXCG motif-containing cysteine-rich protein [Sulfidibacter corallicola]QTD52995.1 CPXCG motif-containing cysteine-rich protein [Sulfidibacter corallicola]
MEEYFFTCPYCWQRISMLLDTSVERQTYIEDCEVCCQPISIDYRIEDDEVVAFEAESIQ